MAVDVGGESLRLGIVINDHGVHAPVHVRRAAAGLHEPQARWDAGVAVRSIAVALARVRAAVPRVCAVVRCTVAADAARLQGAVSRCAAPP